MQKQKVFRAKYPSRRRLASRREDWFARCRLWKNSFHVFAASVSRGVGLKPSCVYFLIADSAEAVSAAVDFLQSVFNVSITGFHSVYGNILVCLRNVFIGRGSFPVR